MFEPLTSKQIKEHYSSQTLKKRRNRFAGGSQSNQKFNAQKVEIDGIVFDSKAEAKYYYLLKVKGITNFKMHESFTILETLKLAGKTRSKRVYKPDFTFYDENDQLIKVVDVKGGKATITEASSLRMRLFMDRYQIPITLARLDYKTGLFKEELL